MMLDEYVSKSLKDRDQLISAEIKGEARGRAEGEAKGKIAIAKSMLKKGMDVTIIAEITGLSKEEIIKLTTN